MKRVLFALLVFSGCARIGDTGNSGNVFGIEELAVRNPPVHSQYGVFTGADSVETALYNLAVDDMVRNKEDDGTFRTGKFWGGVWTRDISYSVILSLAHTDPRYARNSLMCKVDRMGRIIQDTGTGGAWPCSIDRQIWTVAAYELWLETGDADWLEQIYGICSRSMKADCAVAYEPETGLFKGESSFIDWRHQSYPEWTDCKDICQSECLGTNAVFFGALKCLENMALALGEKEAASDYGAKAAALSKAINRHFWMPDKGYYGQYRYGRNFKTLSPRSETLGESLCIIWGIASDEQSRSILANMPVSRYGPTVFWPQVAAQFPYHNNAVWPFVASYYALGAAKAGSHSGIFLVMKSNAEYAAIHGTNYENRVSSDGSEKTNLNSPRQLWSIAGYIGLYRRLVFGMDYCPDGIRFSPSIPQELAGSRSLKGLAYRDMVLDIEVSGYGNSVRRFRLDGKRSKDCFVPASLKGRHTVSIEMQPARGFEDIPVRVMPYTADIAVPEAVLKGNTITWKPVEGASGYKVVFNGETLADNVVTGEYPVSEEGEYGVIALAADDVESFMSEPLRFYGKELTVKAETSLSNNIGVQLSRSVELPEDGEYAIDWLYSNGNGEIETQNKCAARAVFIDGESAGTAVMPQRGKDDWKSSGWSNSVKVPLKSGRHTVELRYLEDDINMNIDTDCAVVRSIRFTRLGR